MAYAIFRTEKYKTNYAIGGLMRHHLREKPEEVDGLDPGRSHLNITIGAADRSALFKAIKERIATTTRKPRPDANRIIENVFTASPEFFQGMAYEDQKAYLLQCVEFAKELFGAENVIADTFISTRKPRMCTLSLCPLRHPREQQRPRPDNPQHSMQATTWAVQKNA